MSYIPTLSLIIISTLVTARAAIFEIRNNCPYTVWAAASPGGGRQLNRNGVWWLYVAPGTKMARIWGRTGCNFDGSGRGSCQTGDCGGLTCTHWGVPPNTLAEYALNQYNNLDFFDISLVDGFNIPMQFGPTNNVGGGCRLLQCAANINRECPGPLRVAGGCNNPCTTFKEERYCCNNGPCGPTGYSRFFKDRCPTSYSYPKDDASSTFTCPGGTNYKVVFCP
ncbi:osmotin-like protein TPM-1 [Apium graveolens]|uniref:osmotin-like protein TPM-1 n=1 Tax=Apium graveolens TaxID=4045 RepID=UPI003D7A642D